MRKPKRCIPSAELAVDAGRNGAAVGEAAIGIMATGAGDGAVPAEAGVEKELPAQFDLRLRERVVLGYVRSRGLQAKRQGQRVVPADGLDHWSDRGDRDRGPRGGVGVRILQR